MNLPNHYATLGAHRQMTDGELRTLYRAAARAAHPDRGGDVARFRAVTAAYAALQTTQDRARYAKRLALSLPPCPACSGAGTQTRTRSFRHVEVAGCPACSGSGFAFA